MKRTIILAVSAFLLLFMECACSPGGTGDVSVRKLINNRCSICHGTDRVFSSRRSRQEWNIIIDRMVRHGAQLNPREQETLKDYLSDEYGK